MSMNLRKKQSFTASLQPAREKDLGGCGQSASAGGSNADRAPSGYLRS